MAEPQRLNELFTVAERFHRSVNIALDLSRASSLEGYVLTPLNQVVLRRILNGLAPESANRSWALTGPYGAGKSACVLFMGRALGYPVEAEARAQLKREAPELCAAMELSLGDEDSGFVIVPMVASRQPLALTLLAGLDDALRPLADSIQAQALAVRELRQHVALGEVATVSQVGEAIAETALALHQKNPHVRGLVLVLDELGRALEFAALYPEQGDIELLQMLAEMAARSQTPIIGLLTVLHQAFEHYAAALTPTQQREWSKVKGRFEEIGFLESPGELLNLVGQAIHPRPGAECVIPAIAAQIEQTKRLALLPRDLGSEEGAKALEQCAPLHPVVALLLGPLFRSRLAQNERSLFAFLCSGEPHGFQDHLARETWNGNGSLPFYRLDNLYDYVVTALGSGLYAQAHGKRWAEIEDMLDRLPVEATTLHARLIKAIGLLSLLGDQRSLRASEGVLVHALRDVFTAEQEVHNALQDLLAWRIALYRRFKDAFSLWEGSDVDLDECYERATAQIDRTSSLASLLQRAGYLKPFIAKRHLHETGTLRYLTPRVVDLAEAGDASQAPVGDADGVVLFVLPSIGVNVIEAVKQVEAFSTALPWPHRGQVLFAVPHYYQGLREALEELQAWDWVAENTPALEGDSVARRELSARRLAARARLNRAVARAFEPSSGHLACTWVWQGRVYPCPTRGALARLVSELCDEVYSQAPIVRNELINRQSLSSAAAGARRTLIERMLNNSGEETLGIQGFPPEMSIYLSVLEASGLHRRRSEGWGFGPPDDVSDPNRIAPLWCALQEAITTDEPTHVAVTALYERLKQPPFGVREGLLPIFLAAFIVHGQAEIALYEEGTFVPQVHIAEFERLLRAPERFAVQRYPLSSARTRLLTGYLRLFSPHVEPAQVAPLNAVRGLVSFAGQLPRFTLITNSLSATAKAVRHVLTSARDPHPLLYVTLPQALGYDVIADDEGPIDPYLADLRRTLLELSCAYDDLLEQVRRDLFAALRLPDDTAAARQQIGQRTHALGEWIADLGLKAFAMRLGDQILPQRAWLESVAAIVATRPPAQWGDVDLQRYRVTLWQWAEQLRRIEEVALSTQAGVRTEGVLRFGVIDDQGREQREVLHVTADDEPIVADALQALRQTLRDQRLERRLELATLARLAARLMDEKGDSKADA